MKNIKQTNGRLYFRYSLDGLEITKYEIDDLIPDYMKLNKEVYDQVVKMEKEKLNIDVYDLFDGKTFLEYVLDGSITDYDGSIVEILVDGYISNLGLAVENLMQGDFLVDEKAWLDICENHKVEVNWANK